MENQSDIDEIIDKIINEVYNNKENGLKSTYKKFIFLSFETIALLIASILMLKVIGIVGLNNNWTSAISIQTLSGLTLTQIDSNLNFLFNIVLKLVALFGIFILLDILENTNIEIIQNIIRNFEIRGYLEILSGIILIILGILNYNDHYLIIPIYSIVLLLIVLGIIFIVSGTRHFINKIINKS